MRAACRLLVVAGAVLLFSVPAANGAPGDIDRSFSRDGFVPVRDRSLRIFPRDMDLDTKGRIVVAADTTTSGDREFGLVMTRIHPDGRVDRTFGHKGLVTRRFSGAIYAMATDSKDRIVVSGLIGGDALIERFRADGRLDRSFGDDGVVRLGGEQAQGRANDLVVLADDTVAVAGNIGDDVLVAKVTASGELATEFAGDGIFLASFMSGVDMDATAMVAAGGEDLIVAGTAGAATGLIRLSPGGTPVTGFSGDGSALIEHDDPFGTESYLSDIALDAKGRLLLAGNECTEGRFSACRAAVARVTTAGELDRSFATRGWWSDTPAAITGVALRGPRIVLSAIVGPSAGGSERSNMGLFQLLPGGRRDPSFSEDGKAGIDFGFGSERPHEVAIDRRGRIVVAGDVFDTLDPYNEDILVARYRTAPRIDRDADGDRVADRRDSCEYIFGRAPTGCPRVRRFVFIRVHPNGRVLVQVRSAAEACVRKVPISLMRASPGRDERVEHGRTNEFGNWSTGEVKGSRRFYARAAATKVARLARCRSGRSERLGPPHG